MAHDGGRPAVGVELPFRVRSGAVLVGLAANALLCAGPEPRRGAGATGG